ncbi:MAG: transaldolase [Burkholderiales bacterium]|nr:transaldolase [Burkholderiales bacterium]
MTGVSSALEQLRTLSTIVADTGDFEAMRAFRPQEATTNPTLILKAAEQATYRRLVEETLARHASAPIDERVDRLLVRFGQEILAVVPGRVSTEIDARLSFDAEATIERAHRLIHYYCEAGVDPGRVLIKIASTWEGIRAAERLERAGIHCNLTLLFSPVQAAACAEAGVTLISPFVGRILDWYKARHGRDYGPEDDPGVASARTIYAYVKGHGYSTQIMAASFRNVGQILALAGCDLLTISPALLAQLAALELPVQRRLDPSRLAAVPARYDLRETAFRDALQADAMAAEKLAEGIRLFVQDTERLEALLAAQS